MADILGPEGVNFFGKKGVNAADPIHDKDVVNLRTLRWYFEDFSGSTSGGTGIFNVTNQGGGVPVFDGQTGTTYYFNTLAAGSNLGINQGPLITYYLQPNISVSGLTAQTIAVPPFSGNCDDIVTIDCYGNLTHSAATTIFFDNLSAGTSIDIISGSTKITIRHTLWETGRTSPSGPFSTANMAVQLQNSNLVADADWALTAGSGNTNQGRFSSILGGSANQINTYSPYSLVGNGYGNNINSYSSGSSILNGRSNTILATGNYSVIGGGSGNTLAGQYSSILGGQFNRVSGSSVAIVGGNNNYASSQNSFIGGGSGNYAIKNLTVVGGGSNNVANGGFSSILGGFYNSGVSAYTVVVNGSANISSDRFAFIGNGYNNFAKGVYSSVLNGLYNSAVTTYSSVLNGRYNNASGNSSTVVNGNSNLIFSQYGSIQNGYNNKILREGSYNNIGNGKSNQINENSNYSKIGNGNLNAIQYSNNYSTIDNGKSNTIEYTNSHSTITNGENNRIYSYGKKNNIVNGKQNLIYSSSYYSKIGNGLQNVIRSASKYVSVENGKKNYADSYFVTVGNGFSNQSNAQYSSIGNGKLNYVSPDPFISSIVNGVANTIYKQSRFGLIGNGSGNRIHSKTKTGTVYYSTILNGNSNYILPRTTTTLSARTNNTIINGWFNSITGDSSSIIGGTKNKIFSVPSAQYAGNYQAGHSFIGQGVRNEIIGSKYFVQFLTVLNGYQNLFIDGMNSSILAGKFNTGNNPYFATIINGTGNTIEGVFTTVANGKLNKASSTYSTVVNGIKNNSLGAYSSILNGYSGSVITSEFSSILNGSQNTAKSGLYATKYQLIGTGKKNLVQSDYGSVVNGYNNRVLTCGSTITGGRNITVSLSANTTAVPYLRIANIYQGPNTPFQFLTIDNNGYVYKTGITMANSISGLTFVNLSASTPSTGNIYSFQNLGNVYLRTLSAGTYIKLNQSTNHLTISVTGLTSGMTYSGYWISGTGISSIMTKRSGNTATNLYSFAQGRDNQSAGKYSVVFGNSNSAITGNYSSIFSGKENKTSNAYSTIINGINNTATTISSTIGNGRQNTIGSTGDYSTVINGKYNKVNSAYSLVGTGRLNTANTNSEYSFIGNGLQNRAIGTSVAPNSSFNFIGTGKMNYTDANYSSVLNGGYNSSKGSFSNVLGGKFNSALTTHSSVINGLYNRSNSTFGLIGNGKLNTASTQYTTVLNGFGNDVRRSGSTIVNGKGQYIYSFNSFIGAGTGNTLRSSTNYSFIGGGIENSGVTARHLFIGNGVGNNLTNIYGTTVNGKRNNVSSYAQGGKYSFIGNGSGNTIFSRLSDYSLAYKSSNNSLTILNGINNWISSKKSGAPYQMSLMRNSTILNGIGNSAYTGNGNLIGNGYKNLIFNLFAKTGKYSSYLPTDSTTILNGWFNYARGTRVTILNGKGNKSVGLTSTIINGLYNTGQTGYYTFIGGGKRNYARGSYSSVFGGVDNLAIPNFSAVIAGKENRIWGGGSFSAFTGHNVNISRYSFIGNGRYNSANTKSTNRNFLFMGTGSRNYLSSGFGAILNGQNNTAYTTYFALIGNGDSHYLRSRNSSILNGRKNRIEDPTVSYSVVVSGSFNYISSGATAQTSNTHNFIGGGYSHRISGGTRNFIGSGRQNITYSNGMSVILNGAFNKIYRTSTNNYQTIINGLLNKADTTFSTVLNGRDHKALNRYALIGNGRNNQIINNSAETSMGGQTILNGINNIISAYTGFYVSRYSQILNGNGNKIFNGYQSTIANGSSNIISGDNQSIIGGGSGNWLIRNSGFSDPSTYTVRRNVLLGGVNNKLYNSIYTSHLGGIANVGGGYANIMLGGKSNDIYKARTFASGGTQMSVIGGNDNYIRKGDVAMVFSQTSRNVSGTTSVILGGSSNIMSANTASAIIGGQSNVMSGVTNAVILGGTGLVLGSASSSSTGNDNNHTYVSYLRIANVPSGGTKFLTVDTQGYVYSTGSTKSLDLIAMNSSYIENMGTARDQIYVGHNKSGWNGEPWDVTVSSWASQYANCGVPLPFDLQSGDKIRVCGHLYCSDISAGDAINIYLYSFKCDSTSSLTGIDTIQIVTFSVDDEKCFSADYDISDSLAACSSFLVLGFENGAGRTLTTDLKFTYTIKRV